MDNGTSPTAQLGVTVLQTVFSLLFPLIVLVTCAASWAFGQAGRLQFGWWIGTANFAIGLSHQQPWVGFVLVGLALAALPLAWLYFRERAIKGSEVVLGWVLTPLYAGGTYWLAGVWSYDPDSNLQQWVFAFLLFACCAAVCETATLSLKLLSLSRPPERGREVVEQQKAHGAARVASEAEALEALREK